MTDYRALNLQLRELIANIPYPIANLANASALLFHTLDRLNWAGFYLVEGDALILGPFQGKPACIKIPKGRGVCGTAWEKNETVRVENVHEFAGHIACDGASNSEIVIPIRRNGEIYGVLDLDSPEFNRFSKEDQEGLEEFVRILEANL
ncbi:MAG: GAF domain-containing protein [Clostridia bacterium]|nr:GAF domain-containing protein [Clostridia bacterium]